MQRDPRVDPRPGDIVSDGSGPIKVLSVSNGVVKFGLLDDERETVWRTEQEPLKSWREFNTSIDTFEVLRYAER